jgi:hypothetical protein
MFELDDSYETREYRKAQLERIYISADNSAKIQIVNDKGQTNYLNITDKELKAITELLTRLD